MKPTHIRIISDIHLDRDAEGYKRNRNISLSNEKDPEYHHLWSPKVMEQDNATVLMIAGDLWTDNRTFVRRFGCDSSWLETVASWFHSVVIVLGNHDYWGEDLVDAIVKAKSFIKETNLTNVFILEKEHVVIGDLKIIGGTLWTDYNGGKAWVMDAMTNEMKDYKYIRAGNYSRPVRGLDLFDAFSKTKKYIIENAVRDNPDQQVIVMTHMAPSYESVDVKNRNTEDYVANFAYFSELDDVIKAPSFEADIWVHGHMHEAKDYMIGETRVLCNPRGYLYPEFRMTQDTGFNPYLCINIVDLKKDTNND